MHLLRIGDVVRVSPTAFSKVFAFGHRDQHARSRFVRLVTAAGSAVELSPGHLIYANGVLRPAADVAVGDVLDHAAGSASAVVEVSSVVKAGLFNPHTLHGDVVVNGVVASTFTTAVPLKVTRALLAVPRALFRLGVSDPMFKAMDRGAPLWASAAVRRLTSAPVA